MAIRFHLDEIVSGAVALALKHRGLDVSTAREANLIGAADHEHLVFARSQDRVVVTHDDDFTRLHAGGTPHAGICYCHKDKHSIGDFIRLLLLINECFDSDEMHSHLEVSLGCIAHQPVSASTQKQKQRGQ
jgi:predicted nuclease of predicted toxin-antitoxin system